MNTESWWTNSASQHIMGDVFFVGVDVGTSSARAALVSKTGSIVASASHAVHIFEPKEEFYEQSTNDIWEACCRVVQVQCLGNILKSSTQKYFSPLKTFCLVQLFVRTQSQNLEYLCPSCSVLQVCLFQTVTQGVNPACVKGIGFDATCSLAVLDKKFQPLSVSPSGIVFSFLPL